MHALQAGGYSRPFRILRVQQRKLHHLLPSISAPANPAVVAAATPLGRLVLKAIPTGCGFAFGDLLTQYFNRDQSVPFTEQYKIHTTLSMLAIGACAVGPGLLHFNR